MGMSSTWKQNGLTSFIIGEYKKFMNNEYDDSVRPSWTPFYIWFVQVCALGVGVFWAWYHNVIQLIWESDISMISSVIATIATIGIARIGWLAFKFGRLNWLNKLSKDAIRVNTRQPFKRMRKHIEEWREMAITFLKLGLLGTIIGFAYLSFSVLGTIDFSKVVDVATLVPALLQPLGTVFFATGVGIFFAIVLEFQALMFISFSGLEDSDYERHTD